MSELSKEHVIEIVSSMMENYPEAGQGSVMECYAWDYETNTFSFCDTEERANYELTQEKLIATFPLIKSDKWPKGCTPPPKREEVEEWRVWLCHADAQDFDAFVQLCCHGEVIYG